MHITTDTSPSKPSDDISTSLEDFRIAPISLASSQIRFDYALPVRKEIVPELVFSSSNPLTKECRTDILLANGKIQLFYRPSPETQSSESSESLTLFAIDLTREKRILQIDVHTTSEFSEASHEFSCSGRMIEGKASGNIERGIIDLFLAPPSLPHTFSHLPERMVELMKQFFELEL